MQTVQKIGVIALIILFPFFAPAQHPSGDKTDSLKRSLPALHDSARIDCLNALSAEYILTSNKDLAEYYAATAFDEAKKINYIHGIAESFSQQSRIAKHFDDDFIQSESLAKQSLFWYVKTENKTDIEKVYQELWYALFAQSQFDEAYIYAEKELERCKLTGDEFGIYDALSTMGVIHYQQGNYDSSFYYYQQARQVALANKNEIWITSILFNFGTLFRAIENYPAALNYYRQVFQRDSPENIKYRTDNDWEIWVRMEYAELFSLNHQFDSAWHYYNLFDTSKLKTKDLRIYLVSTGETYFLQQKYALALPNFIRGLAYHRGLNDVNEVKRTLLDIAKTYFALHNNTAALQYAREGLSLALQTKSKQFIRDGYNVLYSVYDRIHETDSAYFYYQKYITIKDIVVSDQTKGKFAAYGYEQQFELLNKQKLISQQELKIQTQKLKSKSMVGNILVGGILSILLLAFILFRNIMLKRKNENLLNGKTQSDLQHKATALEMQALRAQMNPHFIFNCLNSINSFVLKNETEAASDYLTKFSRLIRMVLTNSNKTFVTLEDELDMLKLYMDMERLRFKNSFDYHIKFVHPIYADTIFIPPLLLQPFVENAIWHGLMHKEGQGNLDIELSIENNTLTCVITDNGIGREKAAALKSKSAENQKSFGLHITNERLALLNRNMDDQASFNFEDITDDEGNAEGTRLILKIHFPDLISVPYKIMRK
jgi:tetratricopeptide (TPR) repeat protein